LSGVGVNKPNEIAPRRPHPSVQGVYAPTSIFDRVKTVLGKIVLFFVIFIASIAGLHQGLMNGSILRFFDRHPNPKLVPVSEYVIGQGFYIFHSLDTAATYYSRVVERYPTSSYADDAMFALIQCWDDASVKNREQLIEEYQKYADKYPEGKHITTVRNRLDAYRTGGR
jgi:hypothetical protein